MTTYTAIANGDIDPDSPITTGLMTLLRDNPIAITEGAAGAPEIQTAAYAAASVDAAAVGADAIGQSELASGAVARGHLDVAVGGTSGTLNADVNINLDAYSFFPMLYGHSSGGANLEPSNADGGSGDAPRIRFDPGTTGFAYGVDWRYIAA